MKKVLVRCWPVEILGRESHGRIFYRTFPADNMGHRLLICSECDEIYAVDLAKQVYIGPPLAEKLKQLRCKACGNYLSDTALEYSESYLIGKEASEKPESPIEIPPVISSIVKEFWGIYD